MKIKKILLLPIFLFCSIVFGQENQSLKEKIIGKWNYVKTIDNNHQEVKHVYRISPNGEKMKIIASGPEITINEDGTYRKQFTEENTDSGSWKIISESEIEYEMVIPENSRQGKLIIQIQKTLPDKKWRKDDKGNFLDASSDKIIEVTETKMKVEYEKNYVLIYKKVVE